MLHWTGGYLGPGGVREILPYPSTLVGYPIPLLSSSYPDTFKRKHDTPSYYLKFSANPLREHVKFLSRHTRWVAGSCALLAYRFLQFPLHHWQLEVVSWLSSYEKYQSILVLRLSKCALWQ